MYAAKLDSTQPMSSSDMPRFWPSESSSSSEIATSRLKIAPTSSIKYFWEGVRSSFAANWASYAGYISAARRDGRGTISNYAAQVLFRFRRTGLCPAATVAPGDCTERRMIVRTQYKPTVSQTHRAKVYSSISRILFKFTATVEHANPSHCKRLIEND